MKYKHADTKQKIIPSPIKLFSPGEAVGNASSGPIARWNSMLGNCTEQKQKYLNTDTAYIRNLGLGELSLSSFETSTRQHRSSRITASD